MRDIDFNAFTWGHAPNGDLATVQDMDALRQLIVRWLLTEPATDPPALIPEETERRATYRDAQQRAVAYGPPDHARLNACIPWAPAFGAGIKTYLNAPIVPAVLAEIRTIVRHGLARLDGVLSVDRVDVSAGLPGQILIAWAVTTTFGSFGDHTRLELR